MGLSAAALNRFYLPEPVSLGGVDLVPGEAPELTGTSEVQTFHIIEAGTIVAQGGHLGHRAVFRVDYHQVVPAPPIVLDGVQRPADRLKSDIVYVIKSGDQALDYQVVLSMEDARDKLAGGCVDLNEKIIAVPANSAEESSGHRLESQTINVVGQISFPDRLKFNPAQLPSPEPIGWGAGMNFPEDRSRTPRRL